MMKTFDTRKCRLSPSRWTTVLLAVCVALPFAAQPLIAAEFVVVSATGVVEPAGLQAGQPLSTDTRLGLEPWGRAVIRETTKCGLTHVVVGVDDYQLALSEDCAFNEDPLSLAVRLQRGEPFAERVKETESGPAGDLVAALSLNPCVFLPRVSEEGDNSRQCPSGYALRGLRCSGAFCDNKDLMCCPYLEGAPDPSFKEVQSRQISEEFPNVMTTKKFLDGLTCWGPYCDNVLPHSFRSSRLANTRTCDWSPWDSDQPATWLDCGEGRFVAGLRCKGDYCGDMGVYCCQARVE